MNRLRAMISNILSEDTTGVAIGHGMKNSFTAKFLTAFCNFVSQGLAVNTKIIKNIKGYTATSERGEEKTRKN